MSLRGAKRRGNLACRERPQGVEGSRAQRSRKACPACPVYHACPEPVEGSAVEWSDRRESKGAERSEVEGPIPPCPAPSCKLPKLGAG
jgi:hypothetical protein